MDNVINISDFYFRKKHQTYIRSEKECGHLNMTMNSAGNFVRCDDCSIQLSAYWVLDRMLETYTRDAKLLRSQKAQFEAEKEKDIHLIAAKHIEKAWRSRSMVPCCPHCGDAIFPTDGFGNTNINKEIAIRRRAAKRQKDKP